MEIKTAIATIIGILMMVTVTVATIVIMGGLTNISVSECVPAEYTALTTYAGLSCGFNSNNKALKCDVKSGPHTTYDQCMDARENLCCPTTKDNIRVISDKCCNITKI